MRPQLQFKRILCPTDFSEASRSALSHAIAVARWFEAELTLVHVAPIVPLAGSELAVNVSMPSSNPTTWGALLDDLTEFAEPARLSGVAVHQTLLEGDAVHEILDLAEQISADLLVMGTRGRSGLPRWLLGSVTESVLRKAARPVLTVSHAAVAPAPAGKGPFSAIVCPVDLRGTSQATLRFGLAIAREQGAALTLLHVVEGPEGEDDFNAHFDVPEHRALLAEDARVRLERAVSAEDRSSCTLSEIVTVGEPAHEILRIAAERHADLIVMGARGPNPIDALFFGSTARSVVRDAACPVFTLPLAGRGRFAAVGQRENEGHEELYLR
jgi:nucleotide-binding universal stress UspA family protein